MQLQYHPLTAEDIPAVTALYIEYYNDIEGGDWTVETTQKRIRQVVTRMDSFGLVAECDGESVGFAMGYFEQYDDGFAYDLVEIVIRAGLQSQGLGTALLQEVERQAKAQGALLIQLQAVNDDRHHRFYGRQDYRPAGNLVLMTKML